MRVSADDILEILLSKPYHLKCLRPNASSTSNRVDIKLLSWQWFKGVIFHFSRYYRRKNSIHFTNNHRLKDCLPFPNPLSSWPLLPRLRWCCWSLCLLDEVQFKDIRFISNPSFTKSLQPVSVNVWLQAFHLLWISLPTLLRGSQWSHPWYSEIFCIHYRLDVVTSEFQY